MFWENFLALCMKDGTSPNAIAKKLGISSGAVTKWKKEKSIPHNTTLKKIADYFNVSIDSLVGRNADANIELKEYIELYNKLDDLDQAEIRGEMKQMLKADKYKTTNIPLPLREADKNGTPPIPLSPRKIAAYGADGTKQINPPNPRKIT